MNKQKAAEFAHWLAQAHPEIFVAIRKKTLPANHPVQQLGDLSDVLSSVGDTFSSAVSAVGDWVSTPSNVNALSSVATAYFKSQTPAIGNAQSAVFQTQLQRTQAGLSPAPISYTQNASGQYIPVYAGNTALSPTMLQGLQPNFMQKYGVLLGVGAGALLLILVITR